MRQEARSVEEGLLGRLKSVEAARRRLAALTASR
jgi:hypothetical protein